MAWDAPKAKTAAFSSKLKTFVRDVANLKRSRDSYHDERKAKPVSPEPWIIEGDLPEERAQQTPGLTVQLALSFQDPLDFSYNRTYHSSANFQPNERICRGLLRRIDHNSSELITRKDLNALTATHADGSEKTKRFEMTVTISRGSSPWAARSYKSYQKAPVTTDGAKEVILSSHRMVGVFLKHHDPDFVWKDGPVRDEIPKTPETSPYRVGGVQSIQCVPRSQFLEKSQTFETIPGFTVTLSLTARSARRKPPEWQTTIEVKSGQTTPLNLMAAEVLFSDASYAVEGALRSRKMVIQEQHAHCVSASCPHYEEDATEINLRITNNLGPEFDHLERTILSKVAVIDQPGVPDAVEFLDRLEKSLAEAQATADMTMSRLNDLDFKILELRGRGWTLDDPLLFTLGPSESLSRQTVEAVLERASTSVADILRGNALSVRMSASKRGHLILDKTLVAREPAGSRWTTPSKNKAKVVEKLRGRITHDIELLCKDTCSIVHFDDEIVISTPAQAQSESTKAEDISPDEVPLPETPSEGTENTLQPDPLEGENIETSTPLTEADPATAISDAASLSKVMLPAKAVRCRKTGNRIFPLMPSTSSYGLTDLFSSDVAEVGLDETVDDRAAEVPSEPTVLSQDTEPTSLAMPGNSDENLAVAVEAPIQQDDLQQTHEGTSERNGRQTYTDSYFEREQDDADKAANHDLSQSSTIDEHSIAPSTPSLEFYSGESPRTSLMFTPHLPASMSTADEDLYKGQVGHDEHPNNNSSDNIGIHQSDSHDPTAFDLPRDILISSLLEQEQDVGSENTHSIAESAEQSDPQHDESFDSSMDGINSSICTLIDDGMVDSSGSETEVPMKELFDDEETVLAPLNHRIEHEHQERNNDETEAQDEIPVSGIQVAETTLDQSREGAPDTSESVMATDALPVVVSSTESVGSKDLPSPTDSGFKTPTDNMEFAQTREEFDFDFSSPWSAASPMAEDRQPPRYADARTRTRSRTNQEDSFDDLSDVNVTRPSPGPLVRPALTKHTRTKSFGSAGLLGFHGNEQRLIEVGMHRAILMGTKTKPWTSFYGRDHDGMTLVRPASSRGPEPHMVRRPFSSSGRELQFTMRPRSPGWESHSLVKRSASSNMLAQKREEVEGKDGEEATGTSPGLMLIFAGLASSMLRPK